MKLVIIGLIVDSNKKERRVPIIPCDAHRIVGDGHKVIFESGVGNRAGISDSDYLNQGCILKSREYILGRSHLILCINILRKDDVTLLSNKCIFSCLANPKVNSEEIREFSSRKKNLLGYEYYIKSNNEELMSNNNDLLGLLSYNKSMKMLSENKGIIANEFPNNKKVKICIIGYGDTGKSVAKEAYKNNCIVTVYDTHSENLKTHPKGSFNERFIYNKKMFLKHIHCFDIIFICEFSDNDLEIDKSWFELMSENSIITDLTYPVGCKVHFINTRNRDSVIRYNTKIIYTPKNILGSLYKTGSNIFSFGLHPMISEISQNKNIKNINKSLVVRQGKIMSGLILEGGKSSRQSILKEILEKEKENLKISKKLSRAFSESENINFIDK